MFRFAIVGFLTAGAFLGRAYFDYYFTLVACVAVLRQVCETTWAEAESEPQGPVKTASQEGLLPTMLTDVASCVR